MSLSQATLGISAQSSQQCEAAGVAKPLLSQVLVDSQQCELHPKACFSHQDAAFLLE